MSTILINNQTGEQELAKVGYVLPKPAVKTRNKNKIKHGK
jgi:hypothetical protein